MAKRALGTQRKLDYFITLQERQVTPELLGNNYHLLGEASIHP